MRRFHSQHPNIENKTRCGLVKESVYVLKSVGLITCKRCLRHIERERTGNKIIFVDNENE